MTTKHLTLEEIKRLYEAEGSEYIRLTAERTCAAPQIAKQYIELHEKCERLEEALRFYANKDNYTSLPSLSTCLSLNDKGEIIPIHDIPLAKMDSGERARKALEGK